MAPTNAVVYQQWKCYIFSALFVITKRRNLWPLRIHCGVMFVFIALFVPFSCPLRPKCIQFVERIALLIFSLAILGFLWRCSPVLVHFKCIISPRTHTRPNTPVWMEKQNRLGCDVYLWLMVNNLVALFVSFELTFIIHWQCSDGAWSSEEHDLPNSTIQRRTRFSDELDSPINSIHRTARILHHCAPTKTSFGMGLPRKTVRTWLMNRPNRLKSRRVKLEEDSSQTSRRKLHRHSFDRARLKKL